MAIDYDGDFDFAALNAALDKAMPRALKKAGDVIGERSDARTPVLTGKALKKANQQRRYDPGALVRSRDVQVISGGTVAISYSEFTAAWQHERLDYHHAHGEAKFLERTLNEDADEAMDAAAAEIERSL